MNPQLIADLKEMLRDALKADDYAKVREFAGYLEELLAGATPVKRYKKEKMAKKAGRPAKAKPAKVTKAEKTPRGLAQFAPGTKLTTVYKGEELVLTVQEDFSVERNGTAYPNLAQFVDAFAGKNQANHLRAIGTWKVGQ